jgi:hypothetical protein
MVLWVGSVNLGSPSRVKHWICGPPTQQQAHSRLGCLGGTPPSWLRDGLFKGASKALSCELSREGGLTPFLPSLLL